MKFEWPDCQEMREMLRAMQAGELTVSRGVEILEQWTAGNWDNSMLPPVRQDLIEEDSMPVEIIDRLKAQLEATKLQLRHAEHAGADMQKALMAVREFILSGEPLPKLQ